MQIDAAPLITVSMQPVPSGAPAPAVPRAAHRRGTLRVYLGAAPGVGKSFAMLNEGRRRNERGTDVVVGYVETHGRAHTAEQIGDLEVVPRRVLTYRGAALEEMDLDAVLARHPNVALVDELAHTNVPGSKHAKRWEDVDVLLDAGIDVISTVNIQHIESINDVVERITGIKQRETLPDQIVRAADQIELVDMTPEALRRRMAHGNIYAPEKIDAAPGQLLPPRQPGGTARAGAAVGRRPGRRRPGGVPRAPRHHRTLGDARSAWSWPSRVPRAPTRWCAGRPASPSERTASCWACTCGPTTDWWAAARPSTTSAGCSRRWAASTTRRPATTSPPRWSSSPGPRTPRSSSLAPANGRAGRS